VNNVTTLQNDALAVQEAPLMTPAEQAEVLKILHMPDVSGMALPEDPSAADLTGLVLGLEERIAFADAVYAAAMKEAREMVAIARAQIKRQIEATGGSRIADAEFEIYIERKSTRGKPVKTISKLLQLRALIAPAEFNAAFSRVVTIQSNLDDDTVGRIKALIPDADNVVRDVWDADGGQLNKLAGANNYGPHSDVGQIISDGYFVPDVPGNPVLVLAKRPPVLKSVGEVIPQ
jgi:hypothetical protein